MAVDKGDHINDDILKGRREREGGREGEEKRVRGEEGGEEEEGILRPKRGESNVILEGKERRGEGESFDKTEEGRREGEGGRRKG